MRMVSLVLVFKILQMLVGTKRYFAAHMHKLVKEVVNGVIITEPDKYGTHISRIDLTFTKQDGKLV